MATKLFLLLFLSVILDSTVQKTYQIHPDPCKSGNCFTFADYANDSEKYFISNSIFQFLSGTHTLTSELLIKDAYNISLIGNDSSSLILTSNNSLQWSGCTNVTLKFLEFYGKISMSSTLKFSNCHLVFLINATVHKLNGIIVSNSTVDIFNCKIYNGSSFEGGAVSVDSSNLVFHGHNVFDSNNAGFGGALFINNSMILLGDNNTFKNNVAVTETMSETIYGGGGAVYAENSNITLLGYNLFFNEIANFHTFIIYGGAIAARNSEIVIKNEAAFVNNTALNGGAMYLNNCLCKLNDSVKFLNNSAIYSGGAIYMWKSISFVYDGVVIQNNSARDGGGVYCQHSSFYFYMMTMIISNAAGYRGGGLFVHESNISMYNSIQIMNNRANRGGGIFFGCTTTVDQFKFYYIVLNPPVNVSIINNNATNQGGGIFIRDELYDLSMCSEDFDVATKCPFIIDNILMDIDWILLNNTALNAGSDIFGGNLSKCPNNFKFISFTKELKGLYTRISSHPFRVRLCQQFNSICTNYCYQSAYRGQKIRINTVIAGELNFPVKSKLDYELTDKNTSLKIFGQNEEKLGCHSIDIQLSTNQKCAEIWLFPKNCNSETSRLLLTITMNDCPAGFVLNKTTCVCDEMLARITGESGLCEVETGHIRRPGSGWIHSLIINNTYSGFIWSPYCPPLLCIETNDIWLNFSSTLNSEKLCVKNRTGIMCGACLTNYSLTLNSLTCSNCVNNNHISLMIVFVVAGIAGIALLTLLQMTVATGTINGLIFYANVVNIFYKDLFQPSTLSWNVVMVIISWLNLDFGISTCFYKGLDA